MHQWVFFNDDFIPATEATLLYRDLSIQRGYGIFDFFRLNNGQPVFIEDHLNRFFRSAKEMHLSVDYGREDLQAIIYEMINKNTIIHSGIRITLTGGYATDGYTLSKPNLIISQQHFQPCTEEQFDKGIKLMTHNYQRQLSHVKTIDYLMAIHLQPKLKSIGADDILYHNNGWLRECPRANFFLVTQDDTIVTAANNILKGITRMKLLDQSHLFAIEERDISADEIYSAKEAFITSSTKQVLPVYQIDEHLLPGNFTMAKALNTRLSLAIQQYTDTVGAE